MMSPFHHRILLLPLLGILAGSLTAPVELWHHHDECGTSSPSRNHCALCHHQSLPLLGADFVPLPSGEPTYFMIEPVLPMLPHLADLETHSIRGPPSA